MVTNNPSNFLSTDTFGGSNTDPSTTIYFSSIPTPTPSVEEVDLNLSSSTSSNRPPRKAAAAASAAANNKKVSEVCCNAMQCNHSYTFCKLLLFFIEGYEIFADDKCIRC